MNQTHLAAFRAVAEAGSVTRGAEHLMISQPAVSQHVADLEASLGAKLFDRLPRGVRLTDAGTLLLGYARRIAATEQEAEQAFAELKGLTRGRLLLGASQTIGVYLLPRLLGHFHAHHPEVRIELEIANSDVICQRLEEGTLEIGFAEGLDPHAALRAEVFQTDELVVIAAPSHPAAGQPLGARALCGLPLIFREAGSGTRAVVEAALAKKGLTARPVLSLGSTEAVKEAVAAGLGVAVVSSLAVEGAPERFAVLRLTDLRLRRPLHLLRSPHRATTRASEAFLKQIAPPKR